MLRMVLEQTNMLEYAPDILLTIIIRLVNEWHWLL
jgi:hypothetical protein